MAAGPAPLERCGERLARLIGLGLGMALAAPRRQPRRPGMDRDRIVIRDNFGDPLPEFEEYT
jgi:hypothetical protein